MMTTTSKISSTYLSQRHYKHGIFISVLMLVIILIFSQVFWMDWKKIALELPAISYNVFQQNEYWRLWTAIFVHADLDHFLSNAYMLFFLGYLIYSYYGLFLYPFLAIFLSALVNALALLTYSPHIRLLGASGMVYLLAGIWLSLFILIERQRPIFYRLFRTFGVALIILFPTTVTPQVSYRTHAFGFFLGIITGLIYFFLNSKTLRQFEKITLEESEDKDKEWEVQKQSEEKNNGQL